MNIKGLSYPAIIVKNVEESVDFYSRALGMELLYTEPNRDDAESVQVLLYAGSETYLLLIGPIDPELKLAEASLGVSSMQYLSLAVDADVLDRAFFELSTAGVQASEEIRRGYERLVFIEDPNGVLLILVAWLTEPPAGMSRAAVLVRAAELRTAEDAQFIEDSHIRKAITELSV